MMKKLWSLVLSLTLAMGLCVPSLAADDAPAREDVAARQAEALRELNLFRGDASGNFLLDSAPNRMQALVMLLRLSGKEWEARYSGVDDAGKPVAPTHPFTDAPAAWEDADAILSYAYENGLTQGRTATTFDPYGQAGASMYVTFVLRALGYRDDSEGTVISRWETLGRQAGILPEGVNTADFRRRDLVLVSYAALNAELKDGSGTLASALLKSHTISDVSLATARVLAGETVGLDGSLTDLLGAVYAGTDVGTAGLMTREITAENLSLYLGVDKLDFTEGVACEPMINARAHSVCLVRLKDGADVERVKKDIAAKVNPRKWICVGVEPENVRVENIGNLILLVMDDDCPDQLTANFRALGGAGTTQTGGYIPEGETVDARSVQRFAGKLKDLKAAYFADSENVWYAAIPDKSWYADPRTGLDHEAVVSRLAEELSDWKSVDLTAGLKLEDYYQTDPHWRQEALLPTVDTLGGAMGFTVDHGAFVTRAQDGFSGAYRLTDPSLPKETVKWLSSVYTNAARVKDIQHPDATAVYVPSLINTESSYDLFLSGPTPLVTVESPAAKSGRTLVLFRDSYGSSLAPLLLEAYSKIVLVDLRYMASSLLPQYVDFTGADVLFLYADRLINNSALLK